MEKFVKGDVVVVPFPFSDLSNSKRRPTLIVANLTGDDLVLCQITSEHRFDDYAIILENTDFESGSLKVKSMILPNRLFTADKSLILYRIGHIDKKKTKGVEDKLVEIFRR